MGLKDKLGSAKKKTTSNRLGKKLGNATESLSDKANDFASQVDESMSKGIDKAADSLDDIKTDIKDVGKNAKGGLLKRKNAVDKAAKKGRAKAGKGSSAASKSSKGIKKAAPADNNRLKLLIGLLSLILIGLLGYAANLFLNKETAISSLPPTSTVGTNDRQSQLAEANSKLPEQENSAASSSSADNAPLPEPPNEANSTATSAGEATATGVSSDLINQLDNIKQLDESIDNTFPTETTVAAEELDALQDERDEMTEQEKMISEQLESVEQMTKLQEERIALLEKQLAAQEASAN